MGILVKKVKIMSWKTMLRQKGVKLDMFGHIKFKGTNTCFTTRMMHLCKQTIEIQRIGARWYIMDYIFCIVKQMVIPSHQKRLDWEI